MTHRPFTLAIAAIALAGVHTHAHAAPGEQDTGSTPGVRALILDERLREYETHLLAIEPDALLLTDPAGEPRRRDIRGIIAVLPESGAKGRPDDPDGHVLELTDGQRFPGSLLPTSGDGQRVRWVHERLGELAFPLESVDGTRSMGRTDGLGPRLDDGVRIEDTLTLANGDVLRGFLAELGDPMIFETDGNEATIPAERVVSMRLANERDKPEGVYVWLGDGTIARATEIATDAARERVTFTIESGQRAEYRVGALRGIAFDSSRLTPLATITPVSQAPTGERVYAQPIRYAASSYDDADLGRATLGLATIEFPGPMEVVYELPENSVRVGGTFVLDPDTAPWGDCVVTVELDGRTLFTQRLHPDNSVAPFSVTAQGMELIIRVDPGVHGPILDRVSLRRGIVLLRN